MDVDRKVVKTNEQYLIELADKKDNLHPTPYSDLLILYDTRVVDDSYKDEDGDWISSTKTVVDRKAFIKYEEGKYSFLIDNWFDDIDGFTMGLYAKVHLGPFCNLVTPLGEYLFPNWFVEIEFQGNNLIYCYAESKETNSFYRTLSNAQSRLERVCSIYNRRGQLIIEGVVVKTSFVNGESVIFKDGLYNYINMDGQLLMEEWLLEAQSFDKQLNDVFAFVRTIKGWGIIDSNGFFIQNPRFKSMSKAEYYFNDLYNYRPIAIVEDGSGYNLLIRQSDGNSDSQLFTLGFRNSVDSIAPIVRPSRILAKYDGDWYLFEWNKCYHYEWLIRFGKLDSVESTSESCWIIKRGDLFNVVDNNGKTFKDWYHEIVVVGNLFKVKRIVNDSTSDANEVMDKQKFEYNLIKRDGTFILEEWSRSMEIVPFQGAYLVNIKPMIFDAKYNGNIFDNFKTTANLGTGIIYNDSIINKIQGLCNIIYNKDLLFDIWYDGFEFLNGEIFTDGYLKVWKDGKCNLVDEQGDYVSLEWMDDFLTSGCDRKSYFSTWKTSAFEVKKNNKINLLYNGKLLFDQWFAEIKRHYEPSFSNNQPPWLGIYDVRDGNMSGMYCLNSGLIGGQLYSFIRQISDSLIYSAVGDQGQIMTLDGTVITKSFSKVYPFRNGYAMITNEKSESREKFQYNFIDLNGQIVSPIWFDGDRITRSYYSGPLDSEEGHCSFNDVCKNSKYNLITPDKKLVFKNWYDSISGTDGKWVICDKSRGELKYNFIDNNENLLSDEWFKDVYPLSKLDKGVYVVENETGKNVFNVDNELSLSTWINGVVRDNEDCFGLAVVFDGSHYYYLDRGGHLIAPYGNSVISIKGLYGDLLVIDLQGNNHDGYMQMLCKRDGTPFFQSIRFNYSHPYDSSGSIFGSVEECSVLGKSLLLVNKNWPVDGHGTKKYVIMDYNGKELSEEFDSIGKFDDDGYAVVTRNGLFNLINKDFQLISSLWFSNLGYEYKSNETEYRDYYDEATGQVRDYGYQVERIRRDSSFHNGYLKIELAGVFNIMNESGIVQFPIWYDSLVALSHGFFKVGLNGLFNIVDTSNKTVSDVWFDKMSLCKREFDITIYACKIGDYYKLLFLKKSSATISETWVDTVSRYDKSDGYYPVKLKGKKNYITDDGKLLLPEWYENIMLFWGYVLVNDNNRFNVFSLKKTILLSKEWFDKVLISKNKLFNNGWCGVQMAGKYTFINEDGAFAEGRYDSIRDYCNGFAGVVLDGKRNFLSSDGKLLTNTWFDEACAFASCRKAIVRMDGKYTFINEKGEFAEGRYDSVRDYCDGFAGVVLDGRMNYLTLDGKLLTNMWFDEISAFTHCGKAVVKVNGKLNIIDSLGNLLLPDDIQPVSIVWIKSDYCCLSFVKEGDIVCNKYLDFHTSHLHYSEWEVKNYLKSLNEDSFNSNTDNAKYAINEVIKNEQMLHLIERGETGIKYTMISFCGKSNLVDRMGTLLFEEWVDVIHMYQGVPLMRNADKKWIIVK